MSGHGIIVNNDTKLPFTFTYNPEEINSDKDINYFEAPNIGGSHHRMYFTGFSNKKISFNLRCIDMEDPAGVTKEIAFFEALSEPSPDVTGLVSSFFGNENYPPPKVLFGFGIGSIAPLMWDVVDIGIKASYFHSGEVRGVIGIPKVVDFSIELSLDEEDPLYKMNKIAKKAAQVYASSMSIAREAKHKSDGSRKEQPGLFSVLDLEL